MSFRSRNDAECGIAIPILARFWPASAHTSRTGAMDP